jgi:hypothetical protein
LPTIFDEVIRQRTTFGNILTHQRLGPLHRLMGCDKPHFVPFENEDHIISGLEPERFPVLGRNDNPASLREMCLNWSHMSPLK